jgi:hypothetical protein
MLRVKIFAKIIQTSSTTDYVTTLDKICKNLKALSWIYN